MKKPDIGTEMYFVEEHRYYVAGCAGPVLEYCVCSGRVRGFYKKGYEEIVISGKSPQGYMTPYRFKISDVGIKAFYTPKEAAILAKEMTKKYEDTWGWLGKPDIPMRRTWEVYLDDEEKTNTRRKGDIPLRTN